MSSPEKIENSRTSEQFSFSSEEVKAEYAKRIERYFDHFGSKCWWNAMGSTYFEVNKFDSISQEEGKLMDEMTDFFNKIGFFSHRQEAEEAEQLIKENFESICREYKIHLQPKKEHLVFIFDKLAGFVAQDEDLRKSIFEFKACIKDKPVYDKNGEILPEIVIYPRFGRENFEKVLSTIIKSFDEFEKYGNNLTPRFNHKINDLIFIAQSGGDVKGDFKKLNLLDKYFDKKYNYAFKVGEKPPDIKI